MEKRLEHMKEMLTACIENQLTHLEEADTEELGDAIDMIKDLSEAIYYCKIVKAMDEVPQYSSRDMDKGQGRMYYYEKNPYERDPWMDRSYPPAYYTQGMGGNGNGGSSNTSSNGNSSNRGGGNNGSRQYEEMEYNFMRDPREGRSPKNRRMYMEHKQAHADKTTQMRELENYMQELTQDIMEMIEDSSTEEKAYLSKKIGTLATKINATN